MKRQIALIVWFLLASHVTLTQALEWDDPTITDLGAEPPRASFVLHTDIAGALSYDDQASPYVKSLNGTWKFNWSRKPADRPVDFYQRDYDVTGWDDIQVPGDWQFQGYGVPYYANINYPFEADFPMAPKDYNPVGSYVRTFEVPADWQGKQVFLHFGGVKTAFYCWINGQPVGYREDSKTAAEFNITQFLQPGTNTLAVEVYRWCDGSYLEDQDMWRFAGLSEMSPSWLPTP